MIIEMIPPRYWEQMRQELNALGQSGIAKIAGENKPDDRAARIAGEYDEAIRRKQNELRRESRAEWRLTPKYQEAQRRAAERRKAKRDADPTPRKPPGRPRLSTDGMSPEEVARRERMRQTSAAYRERCREAERLTQERCRSAEKATQSPEDTSAEQSPTRDN